MLDQVERVNAGHPELDPSRCFKFGIEERLLCSSGKVAYNRRGDYILSLNIPLHEATNKGKFCNFIVDLHLLHDFLLMILMFRNPDQLEAFNKLNAEKKEEGKEL